MGNQAKVAFDEYVPGLQISLGGKLQIVFLIFAHAFKEKLALFVQAFTADFFCKITLSASEDDGGFGSLLDEYSLEVNLLGDASVNLFANVEIIACTAADVNADAAMLMRMMSVLYIFIFLYLSVLSVFLKV